MIMGTSGVGEMQVALCNPQNGLMFALEGREMQSYSEPNSHKEKVIDYSNTRLPDGVVAK